LQFKNVVCPLFFVLFDRLELTGKQSLAISIAIMVSIIRAWEVILPMRTVQMTLDDDLVKEVDRIVNELGINRSAFARQALREAIERHSVRQLERQHRQGYERHPVEEKEFSVWEEEQDWGEAIVLARGWHAPQLCD